MLSEGPYSCRSHSPLRRTHKKNQRVSHTYVTARRGRAPTFAGRFRPAPSSHDGSHPQLPWASMEGEVTYQLLPGSYKRRPTMWETRRGQQCTWYCLTRLLAHGYIVSAAPGRKGGHVGVGRSPRSCLMINGTHNGSHLGLGFPSQPHPASPEPPLLTLLALPASARVSSSFLHSCNAPSLRQRPSSWNH